MSADVIAFPDAEGLAVQFLNAQFSLRGDTARAATRFLDTDRCVRVSRVGGPRKNLVVDAPMLAFQCWGPTGPDAAGLGRLTRALVWSMPQRSFSTTTIYRVVETGGLQSFPDPDTSNPRYQFIATVEVRGTKL